MEKERAEIDKIDQQIVKLLEERLVNVEKIIDYKKEHQLSIFDAKREEKIVEKIKTYMTHKEYEAVVLAVYDAILVSSKKYQQQKLK